MINNATLSVYFFILFFITDDVAQPATLKPINVEVEETKLKNVQTQWGNEWSQLLPDATEIHHTPLQRHASCKKNGSKGLQGSHIQ